MGTKKIALLVAAALVAGPLVANATSVTYDFTGSVTSATGIYASADTTVTGTYTINVAAGISSQNQGTVGSTTNGWNVQAYGGPQFGSTPIPIALVFGSTITSGSINYGSASPSSVGSNSNIEGYTGSGASSPNTYYAQDSEYSSSTSNSYTSSAFTLVGGYGANAPFDANGLPVFAQSFSNVGILQSTASNFSNGVLKYNITSFTLAPVPLPAAAWLLLSGVGGLGAFARKKRTNAEAYPAHPNS